jgi:hypothetical protein
LPQPLHPISGGLKSGSVPECKFAGKTKCLSVERSGPANVTLRIAMCGQQSQDIPSGF